MPTLNWIGKEAVINHHLDVPFRLLKDLPELGCGDSGSGNLIVEGDNLVALKALLPYYKGKVKCICIDPPYNTGNEGWAYNDNVNSPAIKKWLGETVGKEGETLDRHDRWLCMMYPRLSLLREFLSEDGSIWVFLDDNEIHALRYVMDEIFGGQNFVATVIWQKKYAVSNDHKTIAPMHDYIAVYQRVDKFRRNLLPRTEDNDKQYKFSDDKGVFRVSDYTCNKTADERPNLFYAIKNPKTGVEIWPKRTRVWGYSRDVFDKHQEDGLIWWGKEGKAGVPAFKRYRDSLRGGGGTVPPTLWTHEFADHTDGAKKELRDVFGTEASLDFFTPKPTRLIGRILQIATNPGDLVLDSFGGSGTTAHAVLKMNAAQKGSAGTPARIENNGGEAATNKEADKSVRAPVGAPLEDRRFILVELEPKIARDITRERVKRVAEGYTNAKGEKVPGLGGGFRYVTLGDELFDQHGRINEDKVRFADLARHVYFSETGEPLQERMKDEGGRMKKMWPLLGIHHGRAVYLLYNGILNDKSVDGGNVLTSATLAHLPAHDGPKVVYAAGCRFSKTRLEREGITFKQTPYAIRTR